MTSRWGKRLRNSRDLFRKRWFRALLILASIPLIVSILLVAYYTVWAIQFDFERVTRMPQTSFVYDRNGYVIQRLYDEHRIVVSSDDIPDVLRDAILSKEDSRFYYHPGFDPIAIARSVIINLASGEIATGASTITQQLARNSAGMFEQTLDRKLKEIFLAIRIEGALSKEEILVHYFNRIYFGGNVNGIGAAADAYFGKPPRELTLSEAAMLVGIIAAPNTFTPWKNPEKAKEVRAFTLDRMLDQGYISDQQATAAKEQPLTLRPLVDLPGTYLISIIRDFMPEFVDDELLFQGGLHIYTTIDLAFQKSASQQLQQSLEKIEAMPGYRNTTRKQYLQIRQNSTLPPSYLQGAFVAISNEDGGILSMVGGRHFEESRFNRAAYGRRQIGSTIKPFVYAHGFNVLNFTAFTEIDHSPFDLKLASENTPYVGDDPEWISLKSALIRSDNYAAMRAGLASGIESFTYFMSNLVDSPIQPYPSSILGACELTPLELASAYTIFPNYGVQLEPYLIQKIETQDQILLYQHIDERKRALSSLIAFQMHDILAGVIEQGTASRLRSDFAIKTPLGGKTGTTNNYKDSWFAGYSSEITAVVWVGLDKPTQIHPSGYSSKIAVPVWGSIMKPALEAYPSSPFLPPPGVRKVQQKKEESFLWIFKSTKVEGPAEYIRDDQRAGALVRLEADTVPTDSFAPEDPSIVKRVWNWIWKKKPQDQFEDFGEEEPNAIIHDTIETHAPSATPVE
ncbi:MAG: transglycosylase domain-containing protein [Verrucomicrobiota bacterium]